MVGTNIYFPAGQEEIDNVEEEPMMTKAALMDTLTDYANERGDQDLLETFDEWRKEKMGSLPETYTYAQMLQLLRKLSHNISKLSKEKECLDYQMAITDSMLVIMKEMAAL